MPVSGSIRGNFESLPVLKIPHGWMSQFYVALAPSKRDILRATSHTRLGARDHYYTSSTLIGGKSGAGPSSLRTTLEGPTEYLTARWM